MAAVVSSIVLPCRPKTPSFVASRAKCCGEVFTRRSPFIKSLAFSSTLGSIAFPNDSGGSLIRALENPKPLRRSVVCEATPKKKADSAAKRARQAAKRRLYNRARKSEIKTRMKKAFESLKLLKLKTDAQADDILPVEKVIAEAYSAIDKAVKSGTLHRNTGSNRKSRLARKKKTVEIHHGWGDFAGNKGSGSGKLR